jgi:beta-galactosidase
VLKQAINSLIIEMATGLSAYFNMIMSRFGPNPSMSSRTSTIVAAALLALTIAAVNANANPAQVYPSSDAAYTQSLNGDWSFKYVQGLEPGLDAGFTEPRFDVSGWKAIAVPSNWELKGFAEPSYADELKDGLGLYRRTFRVPAGWKARRTFLRFEGVAFGYEVWINGRKAGGSSASAFNRHTFDVTDFLRPDPDADNVLAVRVTTKPHGFEFDLNDDWSLSGIYRDVSLFSLPAVHVRDLSTSTVVQPDSSANLAIDVALSQAGGEAEVGGAAEAEGEVLATLLAPDGSVAGELSLPPGERQHRAGTMHIARPALWTAETPSLYRLQLTLSLGGVVQQRISERIGLRQVSIANGVLLLNGRPIKMRGVNHHDLDPVTGRAVTEAQMRQDLELMKKANVNYLRTSHYPPHPRLLELCDELGIYVMDEVAIGHGEKNLEKPAYREAILARVEPTIARDKNRASVLVWSIGNENPITDAELEAGRLAKALDPTRPITYPKIGSYFAKNYERLPAFVDIYAPHYPSNATLKDYAQKLKRPTILTEYAHALGLATDRMQDQWDIIQAAPVFAGGSIWHFHDQGLLRTSSDPVDAGKPTQMVWLDKYRYYDTHGLDGADGLTYADRTPQIDYWQMRKVYAPVQFIEREAAVQPGAQQIALTIENRHDFRSLRGIRLLWSLQRNGKDGQQGVVALQASARQSETVHIPVRIPADAGADVLALNVRAVDERGLQINERSIRLQLGGSTLQTRLEVLPAKGRPQVADTPAQVTVSLPQWVLTVKRASGELTIRDHAGKLLVAGIQPHAGRKPTMAEALGAQKSGLWLASMLTASGAADVKVERRGDGVRISVAGRYLLADSARDAAQSQAPKTGADDLVPGADAAAAGKTSKGDAGLTGGYQLDVGANGAIAVSYDYAPVDAAGMLSEAGLSLVAAPGAGELRWIGQGPYAGYPGKDRLNEFGLYHLNRDDLRFRGNRRATEVALLTAPDGAGFAMSMAPSDVAVERQDALTILSHNAVIGGLGNKGTASEVTIRLDKTPRIAGSFTLLPLTKSWPAPVTRWFGRPGPATNVYKPFYHSYDQ